MATKKKSSVSKKSTSSRKTVKPESALSKELKSKVLSYGESVFSSTKRLTSLYDVVKHLKEADGGNWGISVKDIDFSPEPKFVLEPEFNDINLNGTTWKNVVFNNIVFRNARFRNSNFNNCQFAYCHFIQCDLFGSTFADCDFTNAIFTQTQIPTVDTCNFTGANLENAIFNRNSSIYSDIRKAGSLPPPSVMLTASWRINNEELLADLMIWDSMNHPDANKFTKWADDIGDCPYAFLTPSIARAANFHESQSVWRERVENSSRPKMITSVYNLFERCLKVHLDAKGIPW